MSTLVTNEFYAQPGRGDDVANLLIEILGESIEFDGCEIVRIVRDQDDPDHVDGVTRWMERHNFEDYPAWRTERGYTATLEAMLTRELFDPRTISANSHPIPPSFNQTAARVVMS